MFSILAICIISYLLGSIPSSIIVGKIARGIDIRDYGSGNAGATNAVRVLGFKTGFIVYIIDVGKGFLAAYYVSRLRLDSLPLDYIYLQIIAGCFAVIGHIWTIFASFKGGKGVGAAAGMAIALAPIPVLAALAVFIALVAIFNYVSIGSLTGVVVFNIAIFSQKYIFNKDVQEPLLYLGILMLVLIFYTHRSNIKRLLNGTENKFIIKK